MKKLSKAEREKPTKEELKAARADGTTIIRKGRSY
jgi:hypothetical protein